MSELLTLDALMGSQETEPNSLDQFVGVGIGFWCGVFKQFSSYNGYCMRIRRQSDSTTMDIDFKGNYVDVAAISLFCAGTIGYLDLWYNQFPNLPAGFPNYISPSNSNVLEVYNSALIVDDNGILKPTVNGSDRVIMIASNGASNVKQTKALMMANYRSISPTTIVFSGLGGANNNVFYNFISSGQGFNYQIRSTVSPTFNLVQSTNENLPASDFALLTFVENQTERFVRQDNIQENSESTTITYSTAKMTDFFLSLHPGDSCNMWCIWLEDQSANISDIENIINRDYKTF